MSILTNIFGGGVAQPIEAVGKIIDSVYTSEEEKLDKKILMQRLLQEPQMVQAEINKIEAGHRTLFVAGARPAIMWVCALGLANVFLVNPWIQWFTGEPGPELPLEAMTTLVVSLLGLGAMRSVEKLVGRAK